jgi:hypothetical protein
MKQTAAMRRGMIVFGLVLVLGTAACGTAHHTLVLENDYAPKAIAKIEVGTISNDTGKTFDIQIEAMLKEALVKAFLDEGLAGAAEGTDLVTNCQILDYEKGDAFKRWLWPGWGSTVLTIRCKLLDSDRNIGTIDARRTVDAGGAYTAGAWEKVFSHVASDVAQDIREKLVLAKKE